MKMSKLSNQTNSQDPQAVNSRVFVGNLNTFQCSKTDVERMFQRYGRLAGISMHKGYAFVQFTNPFDARNACHGEDGRTVLSQVLDVNMVAEPKPHQIGRKRQNVTKTGNDWDYYYDSYYASTLFPGSTPQRPLKRQRLMTPQNRVSGNSTNPNKINAVQQQQAAAAMAAMAASAAAAHAVQANMLPTQQQLTLHQQSLLQNSANMNIIASCNTNTTNPHGLTTNARLTAVGPNGGLTTPSVESSTTASSTTNNHTTLTNCEQMSFICTNGQLQQLNQSQQHSSQQHQQQQQLPQHQQNQQFLGPFKVYSNPDTLICGNCRECFTDLGELLDHKRAYCKLRFICKCQDPLLLSKNPLPTTKLLCAVCKDAFINPWDLIVHAQAAHMVNIYELGNEANSNGGNNNSHTDTGSEESSEARCDTDTTLNTNNSVGDSNVVKEDGNVNSNTNEIKHTANGIEVNEDVGSPNRLVLKEDDVSLDGRISSASVVPSEVEQDIIKLNGSISSRGSSPALENESTTRSCIVRAVSIEAATPPPQAVGLITSNLTISLTNGATVALQ